jgi:hypothetical protein
MKKIFIPLSFLISISLFQWSCKNPLNELEDFKLNINGGALINPIATINFAYDDSSAVKPNNIRVSFTGNGAKYLYDEYARVKAGWSREDLEVTRIELKEELRYIIANQKNFKELYGMKCGEDMRRYREDLSY